MARQLQYSTLNPPTRGFCNYCGEKKLRHFVIEEVTSGDKTFACFDCAGYSMDEALKAFPGSFNDEGEKRSEIDEAK